MSVRLSVIEQRMRENRKAGGNHRVLFLDFDGVVNVPYQYGTPEYEDAMSRGVYDFFRPEITERLNKLIHDYQLSVVISSSWRTMGVKFCQNSLLEAGFDTDVIIEGTTDVNSFEPRHEEILSYLEEHPDITAFLILDDIPMKELSSYAVETVFDEGYTEACDKRARTILDRQMKERISPTRYLCIGIVVLLLILMVVKMCGCF